MATILIRLDPFTQLQSTRAAMARVFDTSFARGAAKPPVADNEPGPAQLPLDVIEVAGEFVVTASVPGIDPKDLDISIEGNVLTIRGETKATRNTDAATYLRRELRWGSVERSLRLPPTVDSGKAEAVFDHGILTLTLPKRAEAQARTIKVTPKLSAAVAEPATEAAPPAVA